MSMLVEEWSNFTTNNWIVSGGNSVSGGLLQASAGTGCGVVRPIETNSNGEIEYAWFETTLHLEGQLLGYSAYARVGVRFDVSPTQPMANVNDDNFAGIGIANPFPSPAAYGRFEGANTLGYFEANPDGSQMTTSGAPSLTADGDYLFTIVIDPEWISFYIRKSDDRNSYGIGRIRRSVTVNGQVVRRNPVQWAIAHADQRRNNIFATPNTFSGVRAGAPDEKSRAIDRYNQIADEAHLPAAQPRFEFPQNPNTADPDDWRFSVPRDYNHTTGAPLIVLFHQSVTGTRDSIFTESRAYGLMQGLQNANGASQALSTGAIVVTCKDGSVGDGSSAGDRWGNPASVDNYSALVAAAKSKFNITKTIGVGISMGGGPMFNTLTRDEIAFDGLVMIGGVWDYERIYADGNGAQINSFNTAFGISSGTNSLTSEWYTKTAGYRPKNEAQSTYDGIPILAMTSDGDVNARAQYHVAALATYLNGYNTVTQHYCVDASGNPVGHLAAQMYDPSVIIPWIQDVVSGTTVAMIDRSSDPFGYSVEYAPDGTSYQLRRLNDDTIVGTYATRADARQAAGVHDSLA